MLNFFAEHIEEPVLEDLNDENEAPVVFIAEPENDYEILENQENTFNDDLDEETPTGELPKQPSKKNKSKPSFFPKRKPLQEINQNGGSYFGFRKNHAKSPGLRQVLSPKAKCSRGPPMLIQASTGSSSSTPTVSNSSSGGGSSGSASGSSSSRMINSKRGTLGSSNNNGDLDLENLEYPDSPTSHKWFADNSDLSPLTVLDNINLKTEFPYSTGNVDLDKPPDINSITLDSGAEHLFQFAASVPNVPDNTTTFLDIGADTFSQSLYDDLGDINMSDFPNVGAFTTATTTSTSSDSAATVIIESPVFTTVPTVATTVTLPSIPCITQNGYHVLSKPVTLDKLDSADPIMSKF